MTWEIGKSPSLVFFFRVNISLNDRSIVEFALELEDGRKASRGPF